jgi:hypothetical protein
MQVHPPQSASPRGPNTVPNVDCLTTANLMDTRGSAHSTDLSHVGRKPRLPAGRRAESLHVDPCGRQDTGVGRRWPYRVGTLAAIWLAMVTAESAGSALQVLTSMTTEPVNNFETLFSVV